MCNGLYSYLFSRRNIQSPIFPSAATNGKHCRNQKGAFNTKTSGSGVAYASGPHAQDTHDQGFPQKLGFLTDFRGAPKKETPSDWIRAGPTRIRCSKRVERPAAAIVTAHSRDLRNSLAGGSAATALLVAHRFQRKYLSTSILLAGTAVAPSKWYRGMAPAGSPDADRRSPFTHTRLLGMNAVSSPTARWTAII